MVSEAAERRPIVRGLVWSGLFVGALSLILIGVLPPGSGGFGLGRFLPPPTVETFAAVTVIIASIVGIGWMARPTGQRSGIVAYAIVVAIGAAALWWLPQWSGLVAVVALVALIFAPGWLAALSLRQMMTGWRRRAAVSGRLASWLHPSRAMRFYAAFLRARTLTSIDAEAAAYAAMRPGATPQELRFLDCVTAWARGDLTGVLDYSRDVPELRGYEIRALAELGRVDEMITAFAALRPRPRGRQLDLYRLIALAFAGRVDGVRTLVQGKLRSMRPEAAAYLSFIAATAAGLSDDSRRALTDHARESDDESFRRAAQRHLAAAVPSASPSLSPASVAAIAEIEAALGPPRRR
jgi:hypothetical protein